MVDSVKTLSPKEGGASVTYLIFPIHGLKTTNVFFHYDSLYDFLKLTLGKICRLATHKFYYLSWNCAFCFLRPNLNNNSKHMASLVVRFFLKKNDLPLLKTYSAYLILAKTLEN